VKNRDQGSEIRGQRSEIRIPGRSDPAGVEQRSGLSDRTESGPRNKYLLAKSAV
jgi:hypothetical protein